MSEDHQLSASIDQLCDLLDALGEYMDNDNPETTNPDGETAVAPGTTKCPLLDRIILGFFEPFLPPRPKPQQHQQPQQPQYAKGEYCLSKERKYIWVPEGKAKPDGCQPAPQTTRSKMPSNLDLGHVNSIAPQGSPSLAVPCVSHQDIHNTVQAIEAVFIKLKEYLDKLLIE